jgi:aryl-alcohol dehydrogenase-like predicted oxidoreductase
MCDRERRIKVLIQIFGQECDAVNARVSAVQAPDTATTRYCHARIARSSTRRCQIRPIERKKLSEYDQVMELRQLGNTDLRVSPVALGCWPIAGMTSINVNDADSLATIAACLDASINFLDTAFNYGRDGESERLIRRALGTRRDEMVIATKGGLNWGPAGERVHDARPETLKRECEASLARLGTDRVDLLYLHAPDPAVKIAESAGALKDLLDAGKTRAIGASNLTLAQLEEFAAACPVAACQPHFNMLQREIEADILPWCQKHNVALVVYWPLMKGLLAGKLPRGHVFDPVDGRAKYPMYQGDEWQKNQDLVDALRVVAREADKTVAQVVINWTIHRPGITAALCGAKRPDQLRENSGARGWQLSAEQRVSIDRALTVRGKAVSRAAV